jgi:hypothetical protein
MKRRIKYTDEPLGPLEVVDDFLPSPEELMRGLKDESVKVTLALSRYSVAFFKAEAARGDTSYQRMIRHLLDEYVVRHSRRRPTMKPGSRAAARK